MFEFDEFDNYSPDNSDDSLIDLIGPTLSRQSSSSFERVVRRMAQVDETEEYPLPVQLLLQALNYSDWFDGEAPDMIRSNYIWHVQQRDLQLHKSQFKPHEPNNPAPTSAENFVFESAIDRALNQRRFREEIMSLDIELEMIMRDPIRSSPCWSRSQILRVESLSCVIAILCSPIERMRDWLQTDEDCWSRLCSFASLPCIVNAPRARQIELIQAVCWDMVFCSVNLPALFFSTEERLGVCCRLSSSCHGRIPLLYINNKEMTAPYLQSQRRCLLVDELTGVSNASVLSESLVSAMRESIASASHDHRFPGESAIKFWIDKFHTTYLNKEYKKATRDNGNNKNSIQGKNSLSGNSDISNQRRIEEQSFITIVSPFLMANEVPPSSHWINHPLAFTSMDLWMKQALMTFHLVYTAASIDPPQYHNFQQQLGSISLHEMLVLPFILAEGNSNLASRFVSGYLWCLFIVQSSDLTPSACSPTLMLRLISRLVSQLEEEGSTGGHESKKTAGLHMIAVSLFALMRGGVQTVCNSSNDNV